MITAARRAKSKCIKRGTNSAAKERMTPLRLARLMWNPGVPSTKLRVQSRRVGKITQEGNEVGLRTYQVCLL